MSKDFSDRDNQDDIEKYIAEQILNYYGEDLINYLANSPVTTPPPKISSKFKHLYNVLSITCAVVFLTGIIVFAGVFFSSDFSDSGNMISDTSSVTVSEIQGHSSQSESSDFSSYTSSTSSAESENSDVKSQTSDSGSANSTVTSTESHYGTASENENNITDNPQHNSSVIGSSDNFTDSKNADGITSSETNSTKSHPTYSLPEIPDEGTVTSAHTDVDNNSMTNPYDNVITGKQARAGLGLILMAMSLSVTFVLNKFKIKKEVL